MGLLTRGFSVSDNKRCRLGRLIKSSGALSRLIPYYCANGSVQDVNIEIVLFFMLHEMYPLTNFVFQLLLRTNF